MHPFRFLNIGAAPLAVCLVGFILTLSGGCKTVAPEISVSSKTYSATPFMAAMEKADGNVIYGDPATSKPVIRLENVGYTAGYSQQTRTPLWVSYHLFAVGNKKGPDREDLFAKDDRVPNPVRDTDYANSGYDRGHMAPSSPIGKRYGKKAQDATFKMTNMCPQLPGLNQRGWEALERVISTDWAERFGKLWVFAGPIFQGPCKQLESGVRVPSECYMIIVYRTQNNETRALGIIMPQRRINQEPLADFVRPIDDIERLAGIDFLKDLPDQIEDQIESADKTKAAKEWNIAQLLKPSFPAPARPIHVKDCN